MVSSEQVNKQLSVIFVQINVIYGELEENFTSVRNYISAVDFDSNESYLIMIPELFATGYDLETIKKCAEPIDESKIIKFLSELSIKYKSLIYTSFPEKFDNYIYNTAVLIADNGQLLTKYQKIHLFQPLGEDLVFNPGNEIIIFESKWGKFGLSICYDLRFAELYVKQRNLGVNIFLICAEWPITRISHWTTLLQARAIEHQSYIIAINRVGIDKTGKYGGNSMLVDPTGKVITQLGTKETMRVQKINFDSIEISRKMFNILEEKRLL